jgi:hypothetical protein
LLAACFTLHSINATLAIVPQRGAGLWIIHNVNIQMYRVEIKKEGRKRKERNLGKRKSLEVERYL